jgi:hypothetical protein
VLALPQMSRLLRSALPAGAPAYAWSWHWLLLLQSAELPVVRARSALAGLLQRHKKHRHKKGEL